MIINVTREYGEDLWTVAPTRDDGVTKVEVNGNDVPWRASKCGNGVMWDRVGEHVASAAHHFPEETVTVVYRDGNSMSERALRAGVDAPH